MNPKARASPRIHVVLVVAVAENGVIGADGGLPWRLSSDLKHFRKVTMGKPVVMGRKTFESIGKPLSGRDNIVITRQPDYRGEGVRVAADVDAAMALAGAAAERLGAEEICVIGGGEVYRQTLEIADRIYLTEVHMCADGDTRFPDLDRARWAETSRRQCAAGEKDSAAFSIVTLERVR